MRKTYLAPDVPCGIGRIDFLQILHNADFCKSFSEGRGKNGFIFVKSGALRFSFLQTGEEMEIGRGETLFIPQGAVYSVRYLRDGTHVLLAQFDIIYGSLPEALSRACRIRLFDAEHRFKDGFDYARHILSDGERTLYLTYRMYELIWQAVSALREGETKYARLTPAIADMRQHFAVQRRVGHYAELCAMSESGFRRLFVEYTGVSPIEYRNRLRLEEAKKLIDTGEYFVEEAADAVGFTNVSFFCRSYKRAFGCTPLGRTEGKNRKK